MRYVMSDVKENFNVQFYPSMKISSMNRSFEVLIRIFNWVEWCLDRNTSLKDASVWKDFDSSG